MIRWYKHTYLKLRIIAAITLLLLLHAPTVFAQSCDSVRYCIGNAVNTNITSGKTAQWIEVDTSYRIRNIDAAFTFEAWYKPSQQPGKRVYLGGIWGPNRDNNDVWVAYLQDTKITFELSPDNSYLGSADNTIVTATIPDLYTRGWVHLAFTFDGTMPVASIYVDGYLMAQGMNAAHPISILHHQESAKLPLIFGGCNGLYDDSVTNRTFRGQVDEIRFWSKALTEQQIRCQKSQSLEGTEAGLEIYYRCNDSNDVVIRDGLCDATGNNHRGKVRNGGWLAPYDRTVPATFTLNPASLTATLVCQNDSDFTFTITDTSFCGNSVTAFVYYGYSSLFTLSKSSFVLTQNQPQTFTLHFSGALTGQLWTYLYIVNNNRCGDYLQIPIIVNRSTELSYSKTTLQMDTLYVGCQEYTTTEDTITICNQSNRDLTVSNAQLKDPKFSWRPSGGYPPLPIVLKPG
ncbi:MAG TPA: LamG domain-containing protein, partial [Candidatus Kapabacteria bacterium]|nr:LamG domain-containing protein [Candidatus Kapabacteria bacterium]